MDDNARYIVAIADAGSISEAARRLCISQPALSQRLKHLEGRLGTELFDRQTATLTPTYAGRIYLRWARESIQDEDLMLRKVAAVADRTHRRLQIGTSLPRGSSILLDVTERFYRQVKGCTVFFSEAGMPQTHDERLSSNEIDCAVLTPVQPDSPLFTGEPLCRERMLVMAPESLDLAAFRRDESDPYLCLRPETLAGVPFIMPPHSLKHSRVIRSLMDAAGVRLDVVLHSCSNEMTLGLVERGMGVSMLPNTFTYGWASRKVRYYEIDGYPSFGSLYYNRRVDVEEGDDERVFVGLVREWVSEHPELATG